MSDNPDSFRAVGSAGDDFTDLTGRVCPFSHETVAGCRNYVPVSEHGDFPEAADCVFAQKVRVSTHVRRTLCSRRPQADEPGTC